MSAAIAESLPIAIMASGTVLASAADVAGWQDDAATMRAIRDITKSRSNAEALARVSSAQQQVVYLHSKIQGMEDRMDWQDQQSIAAAASKIVIGGDDDAEGGIAFERARR